MNIYHIEWEAWPEGARIPSHGQFDLPASSKEDAIAACRVRWPEMRITSISAIQHLGGDKED